MKKYLEIAVGVMAAAAAVSASAASTAVCSAGTAGPGAVVSGGTLFVQVTFTPRCSNNVHLAYDQTTVAFAVGASSSKGKTAFQGNTVGGGVSPSTTVTCAATGCDSGKATGAADAAMTAANSS
jgi:hypothetical protein